jgi:butyryl-CoA dehydrogenase
MSAYKTPLRDLRFVYYELFDGEALTALPGYEEAGEEMVMAAVEEFGRICEEVLHPLNASGDEEGCRLENGEVRTPHGFPEAFRLLQEGGWVGLTADPDYGGQGLPQAVEMMTTELLCASNLAFAMYVGLSHGACEALERHASDEVKELYLPKLADGTWAGTMCLTEPSAGSDLGLLTCRAEPAGDGSYRLTGNKIFISAGDHDLTENIVHLVLARLPDAPPGSKGISMFLVPKRLPVDGGLVPNGVTCGSLEHKMGIQGSATCALHFDSSVAYLTGEPHRGLPAMFTFMNGARLHVGIHGLALADAAYQRAVAFARERLQGRAPGGARYPGQPADPILVHPDVRRMLLSVRAFVEGARALTGWVALELDHELKSPDPERREAAGDLASLLTPVVKAFQTDLGFETANLALQVCGGYGYIKDYGIEQLVRDARITPIYEGTNGIQALDLVGRKLPAHGGRLLRRFLDPVRGFLEAEASTPEMAQLVIPVAKALERLERAVGWLVEAGAKNPEEAGAGAVDILHLFGWVSLGYLWARMAKVSMAKLARAEPGGADAAFYRAKIATARFFVERLLPRTSTHFETILRGSETIMSFPDEAF